MVQRLLLSRILSLAVFRPKLGLSSPPLWRRAATRMKIAKIHIAIAAGAGCLVLLGFLFYCPG